MDKYYYSEIFQCAQTSDVSTRLVVDLENEVAWLDISSFYEMLTPAQVERFRPELDLLDKACAEWGKRPCHNAADFNNLLRSLGDDAIEGAGIDEDDEEDDEDYDCEP